jgi:hypothetical protein
MRKLLTLILCMLTAAAGAAPTTTRLTWYGHATFRIVTPAGHVLGSITP